MDPTLLMLLSFLAVMLAVIGTYSILTDLYLRDRERIDKRINDEFRQRQRDRARQSPLFKSLGELASEAVADDDAPRGFGPRLEMMIEQSGLHTTLQRLFLFSSLLGLGLGIGGFLLSGVI